MREDLYDRSMAVGSFYHVYNRGVAKMPIFLDARDYQHFLTTLSFYLEDSNTRLSFALRKEEKPILTQPPQHPLAIPRAYCLMPNHFHLVLEEIVEHGISRLLRRTLLSYTRYFNTRYHRVGPLFQGTFRFVPVINDQQFVHLTRYVHLNPYVAGISKDPEDYIWSSYGQYIKNEIVRLCDPSLAINLVGSAQQYREFLTDFASYAREIAIIKDHAIDEQ